MSRKDVPITDERLQAWLDGEFSARESAELLAQVRADEELSRDVCELRMLKDSVKLAYQDIPEPPVRSHRRDMPRMGWSIAAALVLLVLGVFVGWNLNPAGEPARFVMLDPKGTGQAPATAQSNETRIVFHLTNPDMAVAGDLLDEIEIMLGEYQKQGDAIRVEVVAHGDGLGMLRTQFSAHQRRIHSLAEGYPNLTFVACKNTIDRLRVEEGVEIMLLPEVEVIDSGVDHVVRRQKEGWAYIRV